MHQNIKHRQKYRKIASGYQSNVPYGSKFQENSVKDGSKEFWIKNNHIIRKVKRYTISHAHKVGHCLVVEKNEGKFLFLMVTGHQRRTHVRAEGAMPPHLILDILVTNIGF